MRSNNCSHIKQIVERHRESQRGQVGRTKRSPRNGDCFAPTHKSIADARNDVSSFWLVVSILFLSIVILSACTKNASDQPVAESAKPEDNIVELTPVQIEMAGVVLGTVQERELNSIIKVNGKLDVPPQNMITISTPFAGFLKSTELLQGRQVKKGELIAVMQHPDYIQLQQDYMESKSQLDFLEAEYNRQQELAKENVNAQKTLQQSRSNYRSTLAKVQGLKAKLSLLNLDVAAIEKGQISNTINLYSPINGYVTQVNVNIGSFVNPVDVMFKIVNTEHLHAELTVFEKDVMKLKKGQKFKFTLEGSTKEREGTVYLIGREIGPDRSVRVHGHLDAEDPDLLPGMYISAQIEITSTKTTVLSPDAIINFEGHAYIFVATGTHQFKMINVETGIVEPNFTEVILPSGFDPKSSVVIQGAYSLMGKFKNKEE